MMVVPIVLAFAAATPATPAPTAAEAAARAAILAAMADSAAGWNAGDVNRFMRVYSPAPATSFVTAAGLVRGKPAMIARYRQRYDFGNAAKRGRLGFATLDFRLLDPDHALYIARYTLTYPGGKTRSGPTSLVFARERTGWHIIADHSS